MPEQLRTREEPTQTTELNLLAIRLRLTPARRRFADAYALDGRLDVACAITRTRTADAEKWIAEPLLQHYIQAVKKDMRRAALEDRPARNIRAMEATEVMAHLTEVAAFGMEPLFDFAGYEPVFRLTRENAHLVRKIRFDPKTGRITSVETESRGEALRLLGQHYGLFKPDEDDDRRRKAQNAFQNWAEGQPPETLRSLQLALLAGSKSELPPSDAEEEPVQVNGDGPG